MRLQPSLGSWLGARMLGRPGGLRLQRTRPAGVRRCPLDACACIARSIRVRLQQQGLAGARRLLWHVGGARSSARLRRSSSPRLVHRHVATGRFLQPGRLRRVHGNVRVQGDRPCLLTTLGVMDMLGRCCWMAPPACAAQAAAAHTRLGACQSSIGVRAPLASRASELKRPHMYGCRYACKNMSDRARRR